jgi:serine/threonine protein kinase
MVGSTLAHYELGERLGEGGSGVVYSARDLRLQRTVAIKVLADALRDDELAWARLLREARLASQLNHPHIAAVYDLGEEEGRAYIVMEYVEGLPLADLIPEGGMPAEQACRYAAQIAAALGFAHQQGVVHGDLKGSNVIVTAEGDAKLVDFGLGRRVPRNGATEVSGACLELTEAGAAAGTLPYLAPEVLRGNPASRESDVWALGVLLYQMVTGELPFRGATPFELSVNIMVGTPPRLAELPEPLPSVLRRCLEKDPAARLGEVEQLVAALKGDASTVAPPSADKPLAPAARSRVFSFARSHPWRWAGGGAAALCLLLLAGVYARYATPVHSAAQPAPVQALKTPSTPNAAAKVWVNTDSGTYHCEGARWYGKTQAGEYMTQKQAMAEGFHPSGGRACR